MSQATSFNPFWPWQCKGMEETGRTSANEAEHCNGYVGSHPMQSDDLIVRPNTGVAVNGRSHVSSSSTAAQAAESATAGAPGQAERRVGSAALQQACSSEELVGIRACFQLVDLGRQLYVWAGLESGAMGCMCLASPPAGD